MCIVINLIDLIGSKDYAGPPSSYKSVQRFLNPGFGTRPRGSHTAGMKGIDAASRASEWKVAWLATDATAGSSEKRCKLRRQKGGMHYSGGSATVGLLLRPNRGPFDRCLTLLVGLQQGNRELL